MKVKKSTKPKLACKVLKQVCSHFVCPDSLFCLWQGRDSCISIFCVHWCYKMNSWKYLGSTGGWLARIGMSKVHTCLGTGSGDEASPNPSKCAASSSSVLHSVSGAVSQVLGSIEVFHGLLMHGSNLSTGGEDWKGISNSCPWPLRFSPCTAGLLPGARFFSLLEKLCSPEKNCVERVPRNILGQATVSWSSV